MNRKVLLAALLGVALLPAAGCGKDPLQEKAPPPSAEAAARGPEQTRPKNMPGPNSPTAPGGGVAAPSGLNKPAVKPPGL